MLLPYVIKGGHVSVLFRYGFEQIMYSVAGLFFILLDCHSSSKHSSPAIRSLGNSDSLSQNIISNPQHHFLSHSHAHDQDQAVAPITLLTNHRNKIIYVGTFVIITQILFDILFYLNLLKTRPDEVSDLVQSGFIQSCLGNLLMTFTFYAALLITPFKDLNAHPGKPSNILSQIRKYLTVSIFIAGVFLILTFLFMFVEFLLKKS